MKTKKENWINYYKDISDIAHEDMTQIQNTLFDSSKSDNEKLKLISEACSIYMKKIQERVKTIDKILS